MDEEAGDGAALESAAVDPSKDRFPHCIVWTPLPVVSWLSPLIGHVGICRSDGVIVDFAGPFFVNVDNFAFGSPARYIELDPDQCCLGTQLSTHSCNHGFQHSELGTAVSWDDGLRACTHRFQHKTYNFFTCNCHSFVATCLNRVAYQQSLTWNMLKVMALVYSSKGRWVSRASVFKSFAPFLLVAVVGLLVAGWTFLLGWATISLFFLVWFVFATYCLPRLAEG